MFRVGCREFCAAHAEAGLRPIRAIRRHGILRLRSPSARSAQDDTLSFTPRRFAQDGTLSFTPGALLRTAPCRSLPGALLAMRRGRSTKRESIVRPRVMLSGMSEANGVEASRARRRPRLSYKHSALTTPKMTRHRSRSTDNRLQWSLQHATTTPSEQFCFARPATS